MKQTLLRALRFDLCMLPFAAAAGLSVGFYELETGIVATLDGVMSESQFIALVFIQTLIYAMVTGFGGHLLAHKTGLLRPFAITKKPLLITLIWGVSGGTAFFLLDAVAFAGIIPEVAAFYSQKSFSPVYLLSEIFYGGVMEEIMLRFFLMSLLVLILWQLFARRRGKSEIPTAVFVAANVLTAAIFAAGHLPATQSMFGELSALILCRCFLLNGGLGLIFGRLYRKHGIQYAIIAHALIHLTNDSLLFLTSLF